VIAARAFITAVADGLAVAPPVAPAPAQQTKKVPRIDYLTGGSVPPSLFVRAAEMIQG
jgi:hypothetical protein